MSRSAPWIVMALLWLPESGFAAEAGAGLQFSPALRMLGGLGLVLGLILGGYGLLRNRIGSFPAGRKRAVQVVESCPLGPRRSVCLVRVRDREFLLGVTQQQVTFLGETGAGSGLQAAGRESFEQTVAAATEERQP